MRNPAIVIRAEVHSDDFRVTARFDAEPFFRQATDQDLLDLAAVEWGGDQAADRVAREMEGYQGYEPVRQVMDYVRNTRDCGFECHVHAQDAEAWLLAHRPSLYRDLNGDKPLLLPDAQEPDWDLDGSWTGAYCHRASPWPASKAAAPKP